MFVTYVIKIYIAPIGYQSIATPFTEASTNIDVANAQKAFNDPAG